MVVLNEDDDVHGRQFCDEKGMLATEGSYEADERR
jgi:hypothetical protein